MSKTINTNIIEYGDWSRDAKIAGIKYKDGKDFLKQCREKKPIMLAFVPGRTYTFRVENREGYRGIYKLSDLIFEYVDSETAKRPKDELKTDIYIREWNGCAITFRYSTSTMFTHPVTFGIGTTISTKSKKKVSTLFLTNVTNRILEKGIIKVTLPPYYPEKDRSKWEALSPAEEPTMFGIENIRY